MTTAMICLAAWVSFNVLVVVGISARARGDRDVPPGAVPAQRREGTRAAADR